MPTSGRVLAGSGGTALVPRPPGGCRRPLDRFGSGSGGQRGSRAAGLARANALDAAAGRDLHTSVGRTWASPASRIPAACLVDPLSERPALESLASTLRPSASRKKFRARSYSWYLR